MPAVRSNWSDMDPSVTDFIAREARFGPGTTNRSASPRRGCLCLGYAGPSLPRLPLRLFRSESGPLPSEDLGRDGGAGGPADADVARLSQRPAGPLLRRDRGADRLPQGAADE